MKVSVLLFYLINSFNFDILILTAKNYYGLSECDSDDSEIPTLCTYGATFIRENRKFILDKYDYFTLKLMPYLTKTPVLFLVEPNFW